MYKAFSLIELLIVIGIIGILFSLAAIGYIHYSQKIRIERDIHTLYIALKELQVKAKTEKKFYCFRFIDNKAVQIVPGRSCASNGGKILTFSTPFKSSSQTFLINPLGVFNTRGDIYAIENSSASIDCIAIDKFRVCEGKKNDGECNCLY